tara:strand:+ start:620 stop:736 length:117 start_codon:yes stop_codon:yes gene_type:complete
MLNAKAKKITSALVMAAETISQEESTENDDYDYSKESQ